MKQRIRILFSVIALVIIAGIAYGVYIWNKPPRNVKNEKGIRITATAIFDSFTQNENSANIRYLNQAIEVAGVIAEVKKNQAGQTVVYLKSDDPVFGVNCTFQEDPGTLQKNDSITFKGICTGFLNDVYIDRGIMIKK